MELCLAVAQEPRKLTLCDLPADVWREIGELVSLQGIQDLWRTGSRQLRMSLKRVVFRTLRGSLRLTTQELLYRRSFSVRKLKREFGLCFELQTDELVLLRPPLKRNAFNSYARASTAEVTASLYFLASHMLMDREKRDNKFNHVSFERLLSIPWLCFSEQFLQLSLVRNPQDDGELGSHALAKALILQHSSDKHIRECLWHKMSLVEDHTLDEADYIEEAVTLPSGEIDVRRFASKAPDSFLPMLAETALQRAEPERYGYYYDDDSSNDEEDFYDFNPDPYDAIDEDRGGVDLDEVAQISRSFPSAEFFHGVKSLQKVRICAPVTHGEHTFDFTLASNLNHFDLQLESTHPGEMTVKVISGDALTNLAVRLSDVEEILPFALDVLGMQNLCSLQVEGIIWPAFWRLHREHLDASLESLEIVSSVISDDAWNMVWPPQLRHLSLRNVSIDTERGVSSQAWEEAHDRMALGKQKRRTINLLNLPSTLKSLHFNATQSLFGSRYTHPTSTDIDEWSADTESYIERPMEFSFKDLLRSSYALLPLGSVYTKGKPLPFTSLESLSLSGTYTAEIFELLPKTLTSLQLSHSETANDANDAVTQVFNVVFPKAAHLMSQEPILPNLLSFRLTSNKLSHWNFLLPLESYLQGESKGDLQLNKILEHASPSHRPTINLADWLLRSVRVVLGLPQCFNEDDVATSAEQWKQLHLRWNTTMETRAKGRTLWTPKVKLPSEVTSLEWRGDVSCSKPLTTVDHGLSESKHLSAFWDVSQIDERMNFVLRHFQHPFVIGCLSTHMQRLELHDVSPEVLTANDWSSFTSLRWLLISSRDNTNLTLESFLLPSLIELVLFLPTSAISFTPAKLNLRRLVTTAHLHDSFLHDLYAACEDLLSVEIVDYNVGYKPHLETYQQFFGRSMGPLRAQATSSYAPSAIDHHANDFPALEEYYHKLWMQEPKYVHGSSFVSELTFTGFKWSDALTQEGNSHLQDDRTTTIDLGTIRRHLQSSLPFCSAHRLGLSVTSWSIPEGVTVLDLATDPQVDAKEKPETSMDASTPSFPDWHIDTLRVEFGDLKLPSTLTELYLASITLSPLGQDIFGLLPGSLLKLHIYQAAPSPTHRPKRVLTHPKPPPPNIQDIFAPNIYLLVDGRPDLKQWPASLTRLVCNSVRAQEKEIPSNIEILIVKGKILRHPLKLARKRKATRPPAQAVPSADLPRYGPYLGRFKPKVPSAKPKAAAPPPKKKRAIQIIELD